MLIIGENLIGFEINHTHLYSTDEKTKYLCGKRKIRKRT